MKHLSPSEFVDCVEGTLDRDRAAHVGACAACRREAEALRQTIHETTAVDVPDPSPLFWDHFSARVREEIEKPAEGSRWTWLRLRPIAAGAAVVLLIAAAFALRIPERRGADRAAATVPDMRSEPSARPDTLTVATEPEDEAWRLLKDAAGDLEMDDARAVGFSVRPGALDRAVLNLSPRERAELGRLIEAEIRQTQGPRRGLKELS